MAPIVGSLRPFQANTANHMAQIEFGYGDSAVSENHHVHGSVKAGDRVPELTVRYRGSNWTAARLLEVLDPSGFVLLVAHGNEGDQFNMAVGDALLDASIPIEIVEMARCTGDIGEGYEKLFGARGCDAAPFDAA